MSELLGNDAAAPRICPLRVIGAAIEQIIPAGDTDAIECEAVCEGPRELTVASVEGFRPRMRFDKAHFCPTEVEDICRGGIAEQ